MDVGAFKGFDKAINLNTQKDRMCNAVTKLVIKSDRQKSLPETMEKN